jgi:D-glycero-alpha-D-manno-heptose-7-phosphate kinase
MIVSKTPLRISFFSGGSDMPSFFTRERGAALSVTIDKFIYVAVHKTPHFGIKTMYDVIEEINDIERMQHLITKEALTYFSIDKELTIASISDILSKGSGLGSSSAFTVGLSNALSTIKGEKVSRKYLADVSCEIEMNRCGYPIGKQDQYAAAYGGFNLFEFEPNGDVIANPVNVSLANAERLQQNLLLVYSGKGRSANAILQKQQEAIKDNAKFNLVKKARDKAYEAKKYVEAGDVDSFGNMLHSAWVDKKGVVTDISADYFDNVYNKAVKAGALGGKLLGAGGGGFFIFYVQPDQRDKVIHAVTTETECKIYDFNFYEEGSRIVANV